MPTQYVNKATLNGTSTVYWTTTGAPDTTGAQSGYTIANLTNIGVDYTTSVSSTTVGSGGTTVLVPVRRTPTDNSTLLNWKLDETESPFLGTGTNTLGLTTSAGVVTPGVPGFFSNGVKFTPSVSPTGVLSSGNSTIEPNGTTITLSCWINLTSYQANGVFLIKNYRNDGSWTNPFASLYLAGAAATDGSWDISVVIGGTRTVITVSSIKIELNEWTFLTATFDGSNVKGYINGTLVSTTALSGTIDFGTHGPWSIGNSTASNQAMNGIIDDVRVENIVRSDSYIATMYKTGIGLYDGSFGNPMLSIYSDGYANIPPAGVAGRLFFPTDQSQTYIDTGTTWSSVGSGWRTIYDLDFTTQATQAFSGNGNVTIDGKTWTVSNFANARTFGVLNGTGLRIYPNTNLSDYQNVSQTSSPILKIPITSIISGYKYSSTDLRVWLYGNITGVDQNYERAGFGVEKTGLNLEWRIQNLFAFNEVSGTAYLMPLINNVIPPTIGTVTVPSFNTYNVNVLTIRPGIATSEVGIYSSGWPTSLVQSMVYNEISYHQISDVTLFLTSYNFSSGSNNMTFDVKRIKIEYKDS